MDANAAVILAGLIVESFFETEANNTIATANPVSPSGTNVIASIGSSSDTDYFKVQLLTGKTLTSVMTPGASSADYDLFVYNAAGVQIGASERGAGLADTVTVSNSGTASELRYVRVKYYSGGTGTSSKQIPAQAELVRRSEAPRSAEGRMQRFLLLVVKLQDQPQRA
ncbi:hypothetical protein LP419_34815 [Massilia sp. H-1]|nr:hypothetical protein LP419_34815 [Massilia sp. H-1]